MQAVILSAGKGTRLPEVSKTMPKVMVPINGKPLLQWHIENLKKQNIIDIYINLHYLPGKITEYFGNGEKFGVSITYSYEKELLGTGGALIPFKKHLKEDTVILYGDVVSIVDFGKLLTFHKKHKGLITAAIHPSHHPEDSDLVEFDGNCKITRILKKPHTNITIPDNPYNLAALYLFSPKVFSYLLKKTPFAIDQDLLSVVMEKNGAVFGYDTDEFIMDIGTPARLEKAKSLLK